MRNGVCVPTQKPPRFPALPVVGKLHHLWIINWTHTKLVYQRVLLCYIFFRSNLCLADGLMWSFFTSISNIFKSDGLTITIENFTNIGNIKFTLDSSSSISFIRFFSEKLMFKFSDC
jgi:hypothetical protein